MIMKKVSLSKYMPRRLSRKDKSYTKTIPYPSTYLKRCSLLPIFYIIFPKKATLSDTYIPHMHEYIPSK